MIRTPLTINDLEFQNGRIVKVRGTRYNYMDGDSLIWLVGELGKLLYIQKDLIDNLNNRLEFVETHDGG